MVDQPIYGRYRHHAVWEDLIPCTKRVIGCDDQATAFISMRDKFKQYLGLCIGFFHITNVINDDHLILIQLAHLAHQIQFALGLL